MKPLIHCTIHIYRCERRPDWETKVLHYLIVMNCQFMVIDTVSNPHKPRIINSVIPHFWTICQVDFFRKFLFNQLPYYCGECTSILYLNMWDIFIYLQYTIQKVTQKFICDSCANILSFFINLEDKSFMHNYYASKFHFQCWMIKKAFHYNALRVLCTEWGTNHPPFVRK